MKPRHTKTKVWRVDLNLLSPNQLANYEDSLEVLNLMRHGSSLRKATQTVGISFVTVKKYLGTTLRTRKGRNVARKNDSLLRKMIIYENGQEVSIQIKGKKKATLIGQYLSAVGKAIDKNEIDALEKFKEIKIRDIKGRIHVRETDVAKLIEIHESREEPEFFNIYK